MKNIVELRDLACSLIEEAKKGKSPHKEDVDQFCKLSKVILESLKIEITHNHSIGSNVPIQFLEDGRDNKLL